MLIYPILIAVARISVIWVANKTSKKLLLTTTHVLLLMMIIDINKKKSKQYDQKRN